MLFATATFRSYHGYNKKSNSLCDIVGNILAHLVSMLRLTVAWSVAHGSFFCFRAKDDFVRRTVKKSTFQFYTGWNFGGAFTAEHQNNKQRTAMDIAASVLSTGFGLLFTLSFVCDTRSWRRLERTRKGF